MYPDLWGEWHDEADVNFYAHDGALRAPCTSHNCGAGDASWSHALDGPQCFDSPATRECKQAHSPDLKPPQGTFGLEVEAELGLQVVQVRNQALVVGNGRSKD